ncbi:MAG TPA: formylglycine-generating enzyme family protein, partial [Burkholderiaceae bacterium]|nr:formylglycine-generating enzyme family protein [Burkholderiaceae bacterium]HNB44569.1 formylglycine-generating enzyme family protein [Burkholderiaceae bacterium]HNG80508.1 formylglycine-generating enzyme family protein [Burkholderiaceae bacterium]
MTWPTADRWRAPVGDWPPTWASAWGSDRYGLWADLTVGGAVQKMRWIEPSGPAGFLMDSTQAERDAITKETARNWANGHEREPTRVVLKHGFWFADTPCTQSLWLQVSEGQGNPSMFQQGDEAGLRPVEKVSWSDVQGWFEQLARRVPATAGLATLPNELQWEYACRAGTTTAYWWGDEFDDTKANVNAKGDRDFDGSKGATTPVKRYPPNPWGLHDLHGNVWEWCDDVWRERLGEGGAADPSVRAVRGGSWLDPPGLARSASRGGWPRGYRGRSLGFRFALRSPGQVPGPPRQNTCRPNRTMTLGA